MNGTKEASAIAKDKTYFPNEMGAKLAAKVPPVIVTTSEFDFLKSIAEEAKDLYDEAGTLLDFASYNDVWHGWYYADWTNEA